MINILIMTKNGSSFIKEVIQSFKDIGTINVFIDNKTTDDTEKVVRSLGVVPKYFKFIDFSTSRNAILSLFPNGYRIFIDDSHVFVGNSIEFKKELKNCNSDVVGIRIIKDNDLYSYSKITRGKEVFYKGLVHEYINKPREYTIKSCYFVELNNKEHLLRTLNRIPKDIEIMLEEPIYFRNIYYIARSLLLYNQYSRVSRRFIRYWLIQLVSMNDCVYKKWAIINLKIFDSN